MLKHLHISNYALIESLDIDFCQGFSVLTGETGAGKSILLGAMGLLLGGRSDAKAIKHGATKCIVEAVFDIERLELAPLFLENEIEFDAHECILRREVAANGKSRAFINDSPVQVALLKQISSQLIDIHSQHQNLLMGEENFLIDTLDAIGDCLRLLNNYQQSFVAWNEANGELKDLEKQASKGQSDLDYLQHRLSMIDDAQLSENEQEELEHESETLSHVEEIKSAYYNATSIFTAEDGNPVSTLRSVTHCLQPIASVFAGTEDLLQRLESVQIEIDDIADEIDKSLQQLEYDPARLAFVDERLGTIYTLQKRFQVNTVVELLEKANEIREKIDLIENVDDLLNKKAKEVKHLFEQMLSHGRMLSEARKSAAERIAQQMIQTLQSLGMSSSKLEFVISSKSQPDISGLDNVQLLFSANKNVPMRDVSSVASGGEVARLMLSLKCILSQHLQLPTVVFDEIDTGVSGTMAEKMAKVMQQMSEKCQVLCITHLPQIAALSNQHYKVSKYETADGVESKISLLNDGGRIYEIANMLSGEEMTDAAISNAKALLKVL